MALQGAGVELELSFRPFRDSHGFVSFELSLPHRKRGSSWLGSCLAGLLSQLHSIAEGILRKDPSASFQLHRITVNSIALGLKHLGEGLKIVYYECRVRLLGWTEVLLNAEVQLLGSALEPQATSGRQRFWLWNLSQTEDATVEGSRCRLFTTRHGDLQVIQRQRLSHGRNLTRGRDTAKCRLSGKSCGATERQQVAGSVG